MTIIKKQQINLIAKFSALAICIHLFESALPSIMGIKPGLANVITLIVLLRYGLTMAIQVQILRVLIASLLNGSIFTPTFFLSVSGSICSLFALSVLFTVFKKLEPNAITRKQETNLWQPSAISFSVLAAMSHMFGQFILAYYWLIPHTGLFKILPFLLLIALAFGWVNGIMTQLVLNKLTPIENNFAPC